VQRQKPAPGRLNRAVNDLDLSEANKALRDQIIRRCLAPYLWWQRHAPTARERECGEAVLKNLPSINIAKLLLSDAEGKPAPCSA